MFWKQFFGQQPGIKSDFVTAYEKLFNKPIPSVRRLEHLDFVVIDTETTGLNPKSDQILSFGGVKVRGSKINVGSAVEWNLDVPKSVSNSAHIHQIIAAQKTVSLPDFCQKVLGYLGNSIVVGHHIGFDRAILEHALWSYGLRKFSNPILDTAVLASRLENGPNYDPKSDKPGNYSLEVLCERYTIPIEDRHTASGDAFLTALLLIKLLKLAERKGIREFGELIR